ncbi:hypothetical protein RI054_32g127670 [Pseudoscourfieldia marina]
MVARDNDGGDVHYAGNVHHGGGDDDDFNDEAGILFGFEEDSEVDDDEAEDGDDVDVGEGDLHGDLRSRSACDDVDFASLASHIAPIAANSSQACQLKGQRGNVPDGNVPTGCDADTPAGCDADTPAG